MKRKGTTNRARTEKIAPGRGNVHSLTPEVQAKLVHALRAGNFRSISAEYAGVPQRTFFDWMRRGKETSDEPFRSFRRAVIEAEKAAEVRTVLLIMKAAEKDPRHAEWWLSHRFPERWADKSRAEYRAQLKLQHSGMVANVDISMEDLSKLTDEEVRLVERILAKLPEVADSNKGDKNSGGGKK